MRFKNFPDIPPKPGPTIQLCCDLQDKVPASSTDAATQLAARLLLTTVSYKLDFSPATWGGQVIVTSPQNTKKQVLIAGLALAAS